ncbi:MAG TPA: hypothetical protein VJ464_23930 [Blastocatellia bacterium]|nr:hypothetical protein [Blastocatellia bacterium]
MAKLKLNYLAAISLFLFVMLNSTSARGQGSNTINGCYKENDGSLRRVEAPTDCKNNEIAISWNIVGPPGPSGTNHRSALNQWWTTKPHYDLDLGTTTVGNRPRLLQSDGADIWVANHTAHTISRVRASDGKLLETWTAATDAWAPIVAMGRVFVAARSSPNGNLYMIDPSQPPGPVITVTSSLGANPRGIAFDGARIWTANEGSPGSVSIVTPGPTLPWSVTTIATGLVGVHGIVYDGSNIWVTDATTLKKLDSNGNILLTVNVGSNPEAPAFDGQNIFVPNQSSNTVTVINAAAGTVVATLSGNGLNGPFAVAFDGQRVLVTNQSGSSVSLWRVSDLTPLGSFSTGPGTNPIGVCSDGINFWIAIDGPVPGKIARF